MYRLLCVEDNVDYRALIVAELEKKGYEIDSVSDPVEALEYLAKNKYDLLISDLKLPVMSGTRLIESAKNIQPSLKTIILTGNPDEESELFAIRSNVDIYLDKSKSFSVIAEYVDSLIEDLKDGIESQVILSSRSEGIELDQKNHIVRKMGEEIKLAPKEYELLKLFLSHKNQIFSREEILEIIWPGDANEVDLRAVDTHVKKLRDEINTFSILTVRGYGYRWNEFEE